MVPAKDDGAIRILLRVDPEIVWALLGAPRIHLLHLLPRSQWCHWSHPVVLFLPHVIITVACVTLIHTSEMPSCDLSRVELSFILTNPLEHL